MKEELNNPNSVTSKGLRSLVIPDCTYGKARILASFRQCSISSLVRELISESYRKNKKKIEIAKEEL